jgi:hypothetical protein
VRSKRKHSSCLIVFAAIYVAAMLGLLLRSNGPPAPPLPNTTDSAECGHWAVYGGLKSQSQSLGVLFSKETSAGVRKPRQARGRAFSRFSTDRTC